MAPKAKPTLIATVTANEVRLDYKCGVAELAVIRRAIDDLGVKLLNDEVGALIKKTKEAIEASGSKYGK